MSSLPSRLFRVALPILVLASAVEAQPLAKSAIQVDPGPSKPTGQTFGYRLTYNCSAPPPASSPAATPDESDATVTGVKPDRLPFARITSSV